jgi:hypothetical protein
MPIQVIPFYEINPNCKIKNIIQLTERTLISIQHFLYHIKSNN